MFGFWQYLPKPVSPTKYEIYQFSYFVILVFRRGILAQTRIFCYDKIAYKPIN